MKSTLCFLPMLALLALIELSCTSTSTSVLNPLAPTISRFFPDTAWTFDTLMIYGTDFGYDANDIRVFIDTARAQTFLVQDTEIGVYVPEGAKTGPVKVWAYEQTAYSAKPIVIEYTFSPHAIIADSVPIGGSFSIPGTGMNNYHGVPSLTVNGMRFPIDSVFPDRIVSHAIPNSYSGNIMLSDSLRGYYPGTLVITRPTAWTTLAEIWDNYSAIEVHHRTGYESGSSVPIDSTWRTTVTISREIDTSIQGTVFAKTGTGLNYGLIRLNNESYPLLQITWDTIHQTAQAIFHRVSSVRTPFHFADTLWYDNGESSPAVLPVDNDLRLQLFDVGYQITEDSSDASGATNWQETTTGGMVSGGSFDLILKH